MKIYKLVTSLFCLMILLSSCDSDYLGDNVDPNNPIEVSPNLILPVAMQQSAFAQERNRGQNTWGNMVMYNWSQSDGFSWYTDEFAYLVTPSFYSQIFNYTYLNPLKHYNVLSNLDGVENNNYKAIAKIMMTYHFQILVDTYGDIPYFDALGRGTNPTPKYDNALDIYEDLIIKLDESIALINASTDATIVPGADDAIYGGTMDNWKKLANTIKLRILVRQSDIAGRDAYISGEFAKIAAEGSGYIGNDVEVQIGYANSAGQLNPKWAAFGQDVAGNDTNNNLATCATPFVLNFLASTSDPRADFIYELPASGHLGVVQGLLNYDDPIVDQYVPANVSNIGPGVLKAFSQGAVLITLAEAGFNQAEAIQKGLMAGDAKAMYEAGIEASFSYLGAAGASTYYGQNVDLVSWDVSANKLEAIITQKWIALNGIDAIQSWFDYSRTGFPSNLPISLQATTADRPVRLAYPSSEVTANGANLPSQPNVFTAKIFWAN